MAVSEVDVIIDYSIHSLSGKESGPQKACFSREKLMHERVAGRSDSSSSNYLNTLFRKR